MEEKFASLKVRDVQCDEMWGYVGMKEKQKGRARQGVDTLGDAYTFVALERNSKLVLARHLGYALRETRLPSCSQTAPCDRRKIPANATGRDGVP